MTPSRTLHDSTAVTVLTALLVAVLLAGFIGLVDSASADPDGFEITAVEPGDETVAMNETVHIGALVENTGELNATRLVDISVDNDTVRESMAISPGQSDTIWASFDAMDIGPGTHEYTITTGDDSYTGTITVESEEPPNFEVRDLEPGDVDVDVDDQDPRYNVTAEIENTGHEAANQTVQLALDGEPFANQSMELEPFENETFQVWNVPFGSTEGGELRYGVHTENDSETATANVSGVGSLSVEDISPEIATVQQNETFDVAALVSNPGDGDVSGTVALLVDETELATEDVELDAGEQTAIRFSGIEADQLGTGSTSFTVSSGDSAMPGSVVVEGDEPAQFEVVDVDPGDVSTDGASHLNLTAEIGNTGEQLANQTVELQLEGEPFARQSLEIPPGETEEFTVYNLYLGGFDPGPYEYSFVTAADVETSVLEVTE